MFHAVPANAGDRGEIGALEGRALHEKRFVSDARMQRELAGCVPEAQDGDVMANFSQRIGDGCRHPFRAGHRIQCAGQEADVAA